MKKHRKIWIIRSFVVTIMVLIVLVLGLAYLYMPVLSYALLPPAIAGAAYVVFRYRGLHQDIYDLLKNMGENLLVQKEQTTFSMPMPAVIVSRRREIVWHNKEFEEDLAGESMFGLSFSRITNHPLRYFEEKPGRILTYRGRHYRTYLVSSNHTDPDNRMFLFIEVTKMYNTEQEYYASRPVVMVILIDSYEEIVKNSKESEKTHILSEINRILEQHMGKTTGFLVRLQRDRYMAIMEQRHFDEMLEQRFPLLEETKAILTGERVPITLSIGIGSEPMTLEEKEKDAVQALDMALGRGGDQVAQKIEGGFRFFGGTSKGVEIRTKVKSRIVASAMTELVQSCDNVLVMGHKFADLDAVGAAIGLARACQCMGKDTHIVLDYHKCLANTLVDYHRKKEGEDIFISPAAAMTMIRKQTLLFVTDTHSRNFVESTDVLHACKDVVVVDHHRKTVDFIDNAVIFYHEPYASSASELVSELVQYMGEDAALLHYHAEALLAGIMLDTKNFIMKTGVRTFEAAAYLRKCGADTVKVRKMFAGSMNDYRNKTQLVSSAEIYKSCAIAMTEQHMDEVRIVASQAADDLLGINGVDASFVLYRVGKTINISARSMGAMNVQVIMEDLGGGGHLTMAATQMPDMTCEKAKEKLIEAIDAYINNNTHVVS